MGRTASRRTGRFTRNPAARGKGRTSWNDRPSAKIRMFNPVPLTHLLCTKKETEWNEAEERERERETESKREKKKV